MFVLQPMSSQAHLLDGFVSIEHLNNSLPARSGDFFNVVGFACDIQQPIQTAKDWKCTIGIRDYSAPETNDGFKLCLFGPLNYMPCVSDGDAVIIKQGKAS